MLYKGEPIKTEYGTFRLAEGYGQYMNRRWEVEKETSYGWQIDFHGTKEQCEEALKFRIEHANELKEKDEQLRKETWEWTLSL